MLRDKWIVRLCLACLGALALLHLAGWLPGQ